MDDTNVRVNSAKAWFLAARPKTLTGAAVPVMIGIACAVALHGVEVRWVPAVLCMLFALIMQIDANFVNDYFDFMKGTDDEQRLGPKRACSQGWITAPAMRSALLLTTAVACVVGLPLILYGGWEMILVGLACVVFCFLYTISLSYMGLGDVLVLVFFGLVPVSMTYWLVAPASVVYPADCHRLVVGLWLGYRHAARRQQLPRHRQRPTHRQAHAHREDWRKERSLPISLARHCSMHRQFSFLLPPGCVALASASLLSAVPHRDIQGDGAH